MGLAADLVEIGGNAKQTEKYQTAVAALGMAFAKNVTSKTWMAGMSDLLEAIENPDRYGPKAIEGFIKSMVPRGIAQIERQYDPEKKYVRTLIDALKQDVPGWSSNMPAELNIWGEPIVYGNGGVVSGMINPIYTKEWEPNDLDNELHELKIGFSRPPETIPNTAGKLLFDPWEYHDFAERAGQIAKASMEDMIKTQVYKNSNDIIKENRLVSLHRQAQARAWAWMLTESKYKDDMNEIIRTVAKDRLEEMRQPATNNIPGVQ